MFLSVIPNGKAWTRMKGYPFKYAARIGVQISSMGRFRSRPRGQGLFAMAVAPGGNAIAVHHQVGARPTMRPVVGVRAAQA